MTTYRFTPLEASKLPGLRDSLKAQLTALDLKGSVLLGTEGFNLSLAGKKENINALKSDFETQPLFNGLHYRESQAVTEPFKRLIVKIKPEIIAFDQPEQEQQPSPAATQRTPAPYVQPEVLKQWCDEGRDILILDTRNTYEIQLGSFNKAVHLNIRKFTDFKQALNALDDEDRNRTIVTFCTGGIRCEKAAPYLQSRGFKNVYQLEGGIINYFKQCGKAHYWGECFVFDKRIAVNENLEETPTIQCWDCRSPLTAKDQSPPNTACPYCGSKVSYTNDHPLENEKITAG